MRIKLWFILLIFLSFFSSAFAQFGIRGGLNMANEIKSFSSEDIAAGFSTGNLTGYHLGVVYELMPKKSGMGAEFGLLITQKGCTFTDSASVLDVVKTGYEEINYLELPVSLRYHLKLGFAGLYGHLGMYAGYAIKGTTVNETDNTTQDMTFENMVDHIDYGLQFGAGVELFNKVQLGMTYSYGLKNSSIGTPINNVTDAIQNKVFSVNLTYLF